jgi:hypothetical protein
MKMPQRPETCAALFALAIALGPTAAPAMAADTKHSALESEAQALVSTFVSQMKPLLKGSVAERGPADAIDVCAVEAPLLADKIASESGWKVSRVSAKPRNSSRGVPDAWERQVLENFDARQAAGEPPNTINFGELVDGEYRYMQAQGVEPVCLLCHGNTIAPNVLQALERHYPDDRATGYDPGEIRGAISLRKPPGSTSQDGSALHD